MEFVNGLFADLEKVLKKKKLPKSQE